MDRAHAEMIAREAEAIVEAARHTNFQRESRIDRKTGTYLMDDATFVGVVVEGIAREYFAMITRAPKQQYPSAQDYYKFFAGAAHDAWRRVDKLAAAGPGDIIALGSAKGARARKDAHVAIVARRGEFDARAKTWSIRVHDSSAHAHFDNSRMRGDTFQPGIGSGAVKLRVNAQGAPTAIQLGPHGDFQKMPIAIGRLGHEAQMAKSSSTSQPQGSAAFFGQSVARAATACEALNTGEFALTTYALASGDARLVLPTTIAVWGPGQKIPRSLGNGVTTYDFVGGVVFESAQAPG